MTKHGYMDMVLKLRSNRSNGSFLVSQDQKTRQVLSNVKVLLTVFSNFDGTVYHEFLPPGRTVNKEYLEVLWRLREAIRRKHPNW